MPKQRYFPGSEGEQIQWMKNYEQKFPTHAATLGMVAEVAGTLFDMGYGIYLIETWHPALQQDVREATQYKNYMLDSPATGEPLTPLPAGTVFNPPGLVLPGIYSRLFEQVARIKVAPNYTQAIGEDLGIIGAEEPAPNVLQSPDVKVMVLDGSPNQIVEMKFVKNGHEGVYIESRVNDGAWGYLGIDTSSPYIDNRKLTTPDTAETREYRVRYWDKGEPNGAFSDVMKVTVGS